MSMGLGILASTAGLIIAYYFFKKRLGETLVDEIKSGVTEAFCDNVAQRIESAFDKTKNFLFSPKIFVYLDKITIDSLFSQISGREKITSIEKEVVNETEKGLTPDFQVIKGNYSKKGVNRETKKIQMIEGIEYKHDQILNQLISTFAVDLGLEEFNYDTTADEDFLKSCKELEEKTKHKLPKNWKEAYLAINKNKQINQKIEQIEQAKGNFVLMQMDCTITKSSKDDYFVLEYDHPINEFKNKMEQMFDNGSRIKIQLSLNNITPIGSDTFLTIKKANLRVFGNLIDFDKKTASMIIRPISIY